MSNPYGPTPKPRFPTVTPSVRYVREGLQKRVKEAWDRLHHRPGEEHLDRLDGDKVVLGDKKPEEPQKTD